MDEKTKKTIVAIIATVISLISTILGCIFGIPTADVNDMLDIPAQSAFI